MAAQSEEIPVGYEDARLEPGYQPLDRLKGFSDGVFAIVITLLVLELPVPAETEAVFSALVEAWPDLLGYFLSFAFVGGIWLSHSGLTKLMKQGDSISFQLNLVLLLFVSLLPFTTKIMVTHLRGTYAQGATTLYGLNLLVATSLLSVLMLYVSRNPQLTIDDVANDNLKRAVRQRHGALALGVVAVIVSIVAPDIAVGLYVIMGAMFLIHPLLWARRSHK